MRLAPASSRADLLGFQKRERLPYSYLRPTDPRSWRSSIFFTGRRFLKDFERRGGKRRDRENPVDGPARDMNTTARSEHLSIDLPSSRRPRTPELFLLSRHLRLPRVRCTEVFPTAIRRDRAEDAATQSDPIPTAFFSVFRPGWLPRRVFITGLRRRHEIFAAPE